MRGAVGVRAASTCVPQCSRSPPGGGYARHRIPASPHGGGGKSPRGGCAQDRAPDRARHRTRAGGEAGAGGTLTRRTRASRGWRPAAGWASPRYGPGASRRSARCARLQQARMEMLALGPPRRSARLGSARREPDEQPLPGAGRRRGTPRPRLPGSLGAPAAHRRRRRGGPGNRASAAGGCAQVRSAGPLGLARRAAATCRGPPANFAEV
jgi:hypothetical protein